MPDPIDTAEGRRLLDAATPGPWEVDDCEGELRVTAGDARTEWIERESDGTTYRVGRKPWTWKSTNLIYEHDLDTWDAGEDRDDDQRRDDAEMIAWARNNLPALLEELEFRRKHHGRDIDVQMYFVKEARKWRESNDAWAAKAKTLQQANERLAEKLQSICRHELATGYEDGPEWCDDCGLKLTGNDND